MKRNSELNFILIKSFSNLQNFTAPQLGSHAIKKALENSNVEPSKVEEVFMGCVLQAGENIIS
jgi:acetyl-CoA acetyltransferase